MANKIETSSKNIKPRINLNHNIHIPPSTFPTDFISFKGTCFPSLPLVGKGSRYHGGSWLAYQIVLAMEVVIKPCSLGLSSPTPRGSSLWGGEMKDPGNEVGKKSPS